MKKAAMTALFLCLSAAPLRAEDTPTSLFFTPAEVQAVQTLAKGGDAHKSSADIHLGAVIYYGPGDWALWLQGMRMTPADKPRADLKITEVTPDHVRLEITAPPDTAPRAITLKPYQSYRPSSDMVVEGGSLASADSPAK